MIANIVFNLVGLGLIILIIWWFWIAKSYQEKTASSSEPLDILVEDGVYTPPIIRSKVNQELILRFIRIDPTPCSEKVIFEDLGVSADLSLSQPTILKLTPKGAGEFEFTCQMGMYRGKLIVE